MGIFNSDYLDEAGAHNLARKIRACWSRQGLAPKLTIMPVYLSASPTDKERPIWVIRSDMVDGRPHA